MARDDLRDALQSDANSIPALLESFGVDTSRLTTNGGVMLDPRPGHEESNPSFSVFRGTDGVWLYKRHGDDGDSGNAFDLVKAFNKTSGEAAQTLKDRAGGNTVSHAPRSLSLAKTVPKPKPKPIYKPVSPTLSVKLEKAQHALAGLETLPDCLTARGFDAAMCEVYGLGLENDAVLIPIYRGADLVQIKQRNPNREQPRYKYLEPGHGAPAWLSPDYANPTTRAVLIVEGEFNGHAAHAALENAGLSLAVQGVGGVKNQLHLEQLSGRDVFVYADGDEPGGKAAQKWAALAQENGASQVKILEPLPELQDFCDLLGTSGADGLSTWLQNAFVEAQTFEPDSFEDNSLNSGADENGFPELAEEALYGLAGDVVRAIEPTTEAHRAALLFSFFVAVGIALGTKPHWKISGVMHTLRLFIVLIGLSGKGRKGTSWGALRGVTETAFGDDFYAEHVTTGLSSGEGLIYAVRDAVQKPMTRDGKVELQIVDEGVADKRLVVLESEFGRVLKVMNREGSTLSPIIRQAWEIGAKDNLRVMTKNSTTATGAHVGIVGHCTRDELLRYLEDTETANGFANRFLWVMTKRARVLPFGGEPNQHVMNKLGERLKAVAMWLEGTDGVLYWGEQTKPLWASIYPDLSEGSSGLSGAVTSRAESYVMRLAGLYAVLDKSLEVKPEHLTAAQASWEYCEESVFNIFGRRTGDVVADAILEALKAHADKRLTKTEISALFQRNQSAGQIDRATQVLVRDGKARMTKGESKNGGKAPQILELLGMQYG